MAPPKESRQDEDLGDLFPETPDPATGESKYHCAQCNTDFAGPPGVKFCNHCGAALDQGEAPPKQGRTVLVVDDSNLARHKVAAILKQLGCEVEEAGDGKKAVERAADSRPDLIVLDVAMPVQDGLETLRILRADERFKTTPIVMLTAKAEAETVAAALRGKASDYLLKDASPEEIKARLRKHLL